MHLFLQNTYWISIMYQAQFYDNKNKEKKQNIPFWWMHSRDERQKINNKHYKYKVYTICIK